MRLKKIDEKNKKRVKLKTKWTKWTKRTKENKQKNKRNAKHFINRSHSLFFSMGIFLEGTLMQI